MKYCDRALFISPYYYGLCLSEKDFHKELKRFNLPKSSWPDSIMNGAHATAHEFVDADGRLSIIVCLGPVRGRTIHQVNAMLVHEATHIWQSIRRCIGEKEPSTEFEAYAMQNIAQSLMEAYGERKKSKV